MAFGDGEVMDGTAEEHVREAARVLSRYCDLIAVRCFPKFKDWSVDREECCEPSHDDECRLCIAEDGE